MYSQMVKLRSASLHQEMRRKAEKSWRRLWALSGGRGSSAEAREPRPGMTAAAMAAAARRIDDVLDEMFPTTISSALFNSRVTSRSVGTVMA
ncbi:hypothetical protein TYRP_014731 [Tyrophagus putrescentiae]|nr:hypothetical protein TYRP_014731 [Tyrophagus putrescentiae]